MDPSQALRALLKTSRDGQAGFETCARALRAPELRDLLLERATECARAAEELKAELAHVGAGADDATSLPGDVHRGWVIAKGALSGHDDRAILAECERGEDVALRDYRAVADQPLPPQVRDLVAHQLAGVQRNHDRIKALRDSFAPAGAQRAGPNPALADTSREERPDGAGNPIAQWAFAQARHHPLRALGLGALAGALALYALARRPRGSPRWLR